MVDMAHFAGLGRRRRASEPVPACACGDDDDPQDTARAARRRDPHQRRGAGEKAQFRGVPRHAGRAADARDCRQGGGLRRGAAARLSSFTRRAWSKMPRRLAETLKSSGLDIISGGTDTHLMLVDLRQEAPDRQGGRGALGRAHITCNKNGIPFDPEKPTVTSGVRLGTPAGTTRGFGIAEFRQVGEMIAEVLDVLAQKGAEEDARSRPACAKRSSGWSAGSRSTRGRGKADALSELRKPRYAGEGLRGRPRIPRSSAAAASASPAISASPLSSACSCANSS